MDFIERWLHISPDGGSGASELLIITALILTIVAAAAVVRRGKFLATLFDHWEQLRKRNHKDRFDH